MVKTIILTKVSLFFDKHQGFTEIIKSYEFDDIGEQCVFEDFTINKSDLGKPMKRKDYGYQVWVIENKEIIQQSIETMRNLIISTILERKERVDADYNKLLESGFLKTNK